MTGYDHTVNSALAARATSPREPLAAAPITPMRSVQHRCVLFALVDHGYPTASLRSAAALARLHDAELQVLRILSPLRPIQALGSPRTLLDALRVVEHTLSVDRSTRGWLRDALKDRAPYRGLAIARGDFVEEVANYATKIAARLIVVPPRGERFGAVVASLACAAKLPVLVARRETKGETILAATDLRDSGHPVLRRAAELGRRMVVPLVALHNMNPPSISADIEVGCPTALLTDECDCTARARRLAKAARHMPVKTAPVIRSDPNPVDAILSEARVRDVRMVVVGVRSHGWFARLMCGSVAAQVVNRTHRSVLVTPLGDSG